MIGRTSWVIVGVMATTAAMGAAMVLPLLGAHRQAIEEQPRVQSLVETVVKGELETFNRHGGFSAIPFGSSDPGIVLGTTDRAAIADYAVEARPISDDRFRVQAWPRPNALKHGRAAAVSYYVDLSANGKIVDQGWVGQDDNDDE
ncbi:MAG: hypothetical protein WAW96_16490 [Alphaproteobacteria bacterium]